MTTERLSAGERPERGSALTAAGHRFNYFDVGAGPPVVLLHGSGPGVSAWSNWAPVLEPLATRFRVIAPDLPGFGLTEPLPGRDVAYSTKEWVAQLIAFLDALEVDTVSLVGNSFGGAISMAAALAHPERVHALVLLGTPAGEFVQTEALRAGWLYEPSREAMRRILEMFPYDATAVDDALVSTRFELSARPGAQAAFRALIPQPTGAGTMVRGIPEHMLERIEQPALILHGRDDRVIPSELAVRIHHSVRRSDLRMFGECGHWVQLERSPEFVTAVSDFIADATEDLDEPKRS